MLSVVYKISSAALANIINPLLDELIPDTQTGFIDSRFIGESTRLIYNLMHTTQQGNINGLLVLIDFEKAFDSISWDFLYSTLEYYNFPKGFIKWIQVLNNNIFASFIQCGTLSEFFPIKRGCRQGDTISPYLFILAGNILNLLINSNKDLSGIKIEGIEYKINQLADDITLLLDGSRA